MGATGKVGRELISQIYKSGDTDHDVHANPTMIVGVASSTSILYNKQGLKEEESSAFGSKSLRGSGYKGLQALFEFIRNEDSLRVVDTTSSPDMLDFHRRVISETRHTIITANKLPLAECSFEEFKALTFEHKRYSYNCSVMAGADAVPFLRDLSDLGERPSKVVGSFSGTLGYVISEIEKGRNLSEILKEAKDKGYTEPNPAVDLSGRDVATKMLILARSAGINANMKEIALMPFVPSEHLSHRNSEELICSLKDLDVEFKNAMANAKKDGCTLRYVARLDVRDSAHEITVGLKKLPLEHQLAQLRGTANKVIISAGPYGFRGNTEYSLEAPGAGIDITARNIRRDLLHLICERKIR